jgi:hypothetical protein
LEANVATNPIVISHAYNGFIYLPLFLAKQRGYLKGALLLDSGSDDNAVRELLLGTKYGKRSDFAICDPIAVSDLLYITGEQPFGINNDRPVVVGSLIEKTPVWLYNSDLAAKPVQTLTQLVGKVRTIRCYARPNTGYFLGKVVQQILSAGGEAIVETREVIFNGEFEENVARDEVVITSNILRMLEEKITQQNFIYSFPSKPQFDPTTTGLDRMFFTGIVTRQSILRSLPFLVIAVLRALHKAITDIYTENIDSLVQSAYEAVLENLQKTKLVKNRDRESVMLVMKEAIEQVLRKEGIYSMVLEPDRAEWERSVALRQRFPVEGWQTPTFDQHAFGMPAALFNRDWLDRVTVRPKSRKP